MNALHFFFSFFSSFSPSPLVVFFFFQGWARALAKADFVAVNDVGCNRYMDGYHKEIRSRMV